MIAAFLRFLRSPKGNVAMIFGLSLVPLLYLTGMGVDYGSAAMREAQLNAIADSASLAAVTPSMMAQGDSESITAATNTFDAQATSLPGVSYADADLSVTVVDSITTRTVTVHYTAASENFFPTILGRSTIALSGTSQAVGSVAPNIDFYLLLDDSPSMALPASSSGITTMINNTSAQGGCAFACHESHPSGSDNAGNPGGEDNYALARALGLTLRIDNVRTATENLTTVAQSTEESYSATYRMAVYTFDSSSHQIAALTSSLSTVDSDAANIAVEEVYSNNYLTSTNDNDDEDTNYDGAMNSINTTMPNPGNGTNAPGDTPQEVLFLVTDGAVDEHTASEPSISTSYGAYCCSGRQQSTVNPLNSSGSEVDTDWCTKIKNRGIRIAVLYTAYLSETTSNSWYNTYIAPIDSNIGPQLEACASPGLYYEVTTDGDISSALAALFQEAVSTAHLTR